LPAVVNVAVADTWHTSAQVIAIPGLISQSWDSGLRNRFRDPIWGN